MGNDRDLIAQVKFQLESTYKMQDLDLVKGYLSVEFATLPHGILIRQS